MLSKCLIIAIIVMLLFPSVVRADAGNGPHVQSAGSSPATAITGYELSDGHLIATGTTTASYVCLYFYNNAGDESQVVVVPDSGSWYYNGTAPTQAGYFEFDAWSADASCNNVGGQWFWLDNNFVSGATYTYGTLPTPIPIPSTNTPIPSTSTPIPPTNTSVPPTNTLAPTTLPMPTATTSPGGSGGGSGVGLFDPSLVMAQLLATAASIFNGLAPIFLIVGGVVLGLIALQQIVAVLRRL